MVVLKNNYIIEIFNIEKIFLLKENIINYFLLT